MKNNYAKAYTEVLEILSYFSKEEYSKIPKEKIKYFKDNMDKDYIYTINPKIDLSLQDISNEANAILISLFRDYFASEEQKEKLTELLNENQVKVEERNELKKKQNYSTNIFENRTKSNQTEEADEEVEITVYKESLFDKISEWMKQLFSKIKHSN